MSRARIAIITQEDSFVIPNNIDMISRMPNVELMAVVKVSSSGAVVNKKWLFFRGFGLFQTLKMGVLLAFYKSIDMIDAMLFYRIGFLKSVKAAARQSQTNYKSLKNPNEKCTIGWLETLGLDLIVSFSAPCIFSDELLNVPKFGCINLHCSELPKYSGLLPSFWVLYEKSKYTGATVHRMDDKIDNGKILGQIRTPVSENTSMFEIIKRTKADGGQLMLSVINDILDGSVRETDNKISHENYRSWPTVAQIREFRKNGGRLI